jgi:hypothetical protein
MISFLFIILASVCNSIMDTSNHHFHKSIFNTPNLNAYWWNGEISWKNKYIDKNPTLGRTGTLVQFTDAFHFFKMLMIVFVCLSIITFEKCNVVYNCQYNKFSFLILLAVYGVIWNTTFSLFYKYVLIKRSK